VLHTVLGLAWSKRDANRQIFYRNSRYVLLSADHFGVRILTFL